VNSVKHYTRAEDWLVEGIVVALVLLFLACGGVFLWAVVALVSWITR
jgi:hypothetical protein